MVPLVVRLCRANRTDSAVCRVKGSICRLTSLKRRKSLSALVFWQSVATTHEKALRAVRSLRSAAIRQGRRGKLHRAAVHSSHGTGSGHGWRLSGRLRLRLLIAWPPCPEQRQRGRSAGEGLRRRRRLRAHRGRDGRTWLAPPAHTPADGRDRARGSIRLGCAD